MIFTELSIAGTYLIEPERLEDERGFFARTWCRQEFEARGLNTQLAQCSISYNRKKGTVRGMHYQAPPHEETKLIRCTKGAVYDVLLDLRRNSPTFRQWLAAELTWQNRHMLYVPPGIAHGFQTMEHETEIFYQISPSYEPLYASGVRWNDPAFAIVWPASAEPIIISDRDSNFTDWIE